MQTPVVTLFGIPQCDTVKKARLWLTGHGVAHAFHDFKKQGVPAERLAQWIGAAGWECVLNRKGTTWRSLDETVRARVTDAATAQALMQEYPSLIKRPVAEWGHTITVGFSPELYARNLSP